MAATARYTPVSLSPARAAVPTAVFRFNSTTKKYSPFRSLVWTGIRKDKGAQPPTATFRYRFGPDASYHVLFEDLLPLERTRAANAETVSVDDRLVVAALTPRGKLRLLFDGFAVIPGAQVAAAQDTYHLPINAIGVGIRLWDTPLRGSVRRWVSAADTPNDADVQTDVPARVNPDGRWNATGDPNGDGGWDSTKDSPSQTLNFPVFMDDLYPAGNLVWPSEWIRKWDLGMLVRYVLAQCNADEEYVDNPCFAVIDDILKAARPAKAGGSIDPEDSSSYVLESIYCRDAVISSRKPIDAIWQQIHPHGFGMAFRLEANPDGTPHNYLDIYRERDNLGATFKELALAEIGSTLPLAGVQPDGFGFSRDGSQVINAYAVTAKVDEVEVGVVCAPLFTPTNPDPATGSLLSSNPAPDRNADLYRLWGADEAGEGYYDRDTSSWIKKAPLNLALAMPNDSEYAVRRRPGRSPLVSLDESGNPRPAVLCLLDGYTGHAPPQLWDRSGTPYPIKGSWQLLRDRLGIRITAANPRAFSLGSYFPGGTGTSGGVVDLVEMLNSVDTWPYFLLVVKIPTDQALEALADRRAASPSEFTIMNRVEATDRYIRQYINRSSFYFEAANFATTEDKHFKIVRDDTAPAQAYAESMRSATELPSFGGSIQFQGLVNFLDVGDRVTDLGDRLDLQCNTAGQSGESPRYPSVVSVQWSADGNAQGTDVLMDDRRAEGQPVESG